MSAKAEEIVAVTNALREGAMQGFPIGRVADVARIAINTVDRFRAAATVAAPLPASTGEKAMQINLDPSSIVKAIDGNKTYIMLGVGMAIVALNHFGLIPQQYVPQNLDPNNWVNDEFNLIVAACFRSGMKKMPIVRGPGQNAGGAIGALILAAVLAIGCSSSPAIAADLNVAPAPAPVVVNKAPVNLGNGCGTQATCSGFYVGGDLIGFGGNANIIGNGINGSLFAAGGALGLDAGWQYWNNNWFFAAELAALYESNPNAATVNGGAPPGGFLGLAQMKVGGNAQALFTSTVSTPSPSQGPIAIPQQLMGMVMSPYLSFGTAFRKSDTQWVSGAGVQLFAGPHWTVDVEYLYGAPTTEENALNMILLGANYHF